tara:strand:+ start:133 stop:603 length:471 start_codon:yes stop_codon:yes gene_type:complete
MGPLQPLARLGVRSRCPIGLQNPEGPPGPIQRQTQVATVEASDLSAALNSAVPGQNGYATGNAKTLHIRISNDGTDDTLTLYAYNYTFGGWSQLYLPLGIKNGGDTTVNDAYKLAQWTTISGVFQVQVPIDGIDRIAFVNDGALADMVVQAAVTTF